jgi:hypothetical protein
VRRRALKLRGGGGGIIFPKNGSQKRRRDAVAVSLGFLCGMARRHPIAVGIDDQACEASRAPSKAAASLAAHLRIRPCNIFILIFILSRIGDLFAQQ